MPQNPKKALKDLEILQKAGYAIPLPLLQYVANEYYKSEGIKQFWKCKTCKFSYRSPIKVAGMRCPKDHLMTLQGSYI